MNTYGLRRLSGLMFAFLLIVGSCLPVLVGCQKIPQEDGTAQPINQDILKKASSEDCPAGQSFKLLDQSISLFAEALPQPVLFSINKGELKCALEDEIREGGVSTWLTVTFAGDCLLNGSLWAIHQYGLTDAEKGHMALRSLDNPQTGLLEIFTNYRRPTQSLKDAFGLQLLTCQP